LNIFETLGTIIAGIGLFFSGVKIVSSSMKNMTSHKFRIWVSKWTDNPILGAFWGFLSGAISQSSSNTSFILMSLVSAGLVKARKALPIISWSNVGTTVLIFLVAINMKLAILVVLGLSGIFFGFDKGSKRENLFSALFGISVLLFGFQLLKSGSTPFSELDFVNSLFQMTANSYILPIITGAILRFLIHSSSTVAVLIMTISHTGLIGLDQVMLMIYGMGIGEGATVLLLSGNVKGTSKQIIIYKTFESIFSSILMIILFAIEVIFGIPLIKSLISNSSSIIEQQTAFTFLGIKVIPTIVISFFYTPIYNYLNKISPPTDEEELSKLKYVNEFVLDEPETALTMIEKEQSRIIDTFPKYIEHLLDQGVNSVQHYDLYHKSNEHLFNELSHYFKNLTNNNLSFETSERLLNIQNRLILLRDLEINLFHFSQNITSIPKDKAGYEFFSKFVESLHANLVTSSEAIKTQDPFDINIVLQITDDKGSLMEEIRKNYINNDEFSDPQLKSLLLYSTDLYQRIIWIINKYMTKL